MSRSKLLDRRSYRIWAGMKERCNNPNKSIYTYYGGKGITYEARWENYANFLADMGEPAFDLTLERLDSTGNYTKENCIWATRATQARNRVTTKLDANKVLQLKELLKTTTTSYFRLARDFNVSVRTIRDIHENRSWT